MAKKRKSPDNGKNAHIIRSILADEGFSDVAIAASLARMKQESGFNPTAINPNDAGPGKHSRGILQWNRDRLANLQSFAKKFGADWQAVDVQARYYAAEVKGLIGGEGKYGKKLLAAKDVNQAAKAAISMARPAGWTPKNPELGHGFKNTLDWTTNIAAAPKGELTLFAGKPMTQKAKNDATAEVLGGTDYKFGDYEKQLFKDESAKPEGQPEVDPSLESMFGRRHATEQDDPLFSAIRQALNNPTPTDQGVVTGEEDSNPLSPIADFKLERGDPDEDQRFGGPIGQMLAGLAAGITSASQKEDDALPRRATNQMFNAAKSERLAPASLDQIKSMIRI